MAGCTLTYPGLVDWQSFDFAFAAGIAPSTCVVTTHVSTVASLQATGALTLTWTDATNTVLHFPGCRIERPAVSSSGGTIVKIPILDRRWRWRFGFIRGDYNVPKQGGYTREKTPRELATLCLEAMAETGFDVSRLPNDATLRPRVTWDYANPASELETLAQSLGCVVILNPATDRVELWPQGFARAALPITGLLSGDSSFTFAAPPATIRVVGAPVLREGRFLLGEALGEDTDGTLKPLDQLSYKPAAGWLNESTAFAAIDGTYTDAANEVRQKRDLATASVYKVYRLTGLGSASQWGVADLASTPEATTKREHLVIEAKRAKQKDLPDGTKERLPAEVWGKRWVEDITGREQVEEGRIATSFSIDNARGVVVFAEPQFLFDPATGEIRPAELTLLTAFVAARDGVPNRYYRERTGLGGTGVQVVAESTLQRTVAEGVFGTPEDNQATVDAAANKRLDILAAEYSPLAAESRRYVGLVPIAVDGWLTQVSWASNSSGTMTTASAQSYHNPYAKRVTNERR